MSPYYQPPGNERFDVGGSEDGPGRPAKQIGSGLTVTPHPVVLWELAAGHVLPQGEPGSPEHWRFMEQVRDLRGMKLPRVLEPVRSYLLFYASLDVDFAQAQCDHARNGDIEPIRKVFCQTRGCSVATGSLLAGVREREAMYARAWTPAAVLSLR